MGHGFREMEFEGYKSVVQCIRLSMWRCQTIDWNKNILKFFLIQEKVYFCKRDNLEYVKCQ